MKFAASATLELINRPATGTARPTPLLFLHGAYAGAWLWDKHYLPFFAERGWNTSAFSFSGHGKSRGTEQLNTLSIQDYVDDLAEVVAAMPVRPVIIAHSMGGLVLQKYLESAEIPAAVLLCSVPPQGLLGSTISLLFSRPNVLMDLNRIMGGGEPQLETVREALFHQDVPRAVLNECYMHMQPESMRALWDMSGFDLPRPARMRRPPMLVLGTEHDTLIPPQQVEQTAKALSLPFEILPNLGHALMLEKDWQAGPERIAEWLLAQGF
ncbi:alpha/beta hydrolase [Uliginosibacterium flavum]|uniref:Alpha/beta fold hydrolase n=1 Tax=Uliginosibacterium flavum TaxID=1396831 RepID=A0ABV2TR53_9RHOO